MGPTMDSPTALHRSHHVRSGHGLVDFQQKRRHGRGRDGRELTPGEHGAKPPTLLRKGQGHRQADGAGQVEGLQPSPNPTTTATPCDSAVHCPRPDGY